MRGIAPVKRIRTHGHLEEHFTLGKMTEVRYKVVLYGVADVTESPAVIKISAGSVMIE